MILIRTARRPATLLFLLLAVANASAQTSTWTGAVDTSWNNAGNWDNGVPNVASEIAVVGAPSPTLSDLNVVLGGLTVESDGVLQLTAGRNFDFDPAATIVNLGAISLEPNVDFQLVNVITNDGTITVDGSGAASDLELRAAATLSGVGEVVLDGANARINDLTGTQTLTNGPNHTIRGNGNVGNNTIEIVNNGLITADLPGETLTVDPNASLGGFENNGELRAENGATLALGSGVYDNSGGVIESAGGQIRLNNFARFVGGTIAGADFAQTAGSTTSFTDITLNATIVVENNSDFDVLGTITNNGTITIASTGSATDVELQGATTFAGTGTLVLDGALARINDVSGTQTLTNGPNHTIRGNGNIGNNTIEIVNNGLITADLLGETLTVDPNSSGGAFDNNATLRAVNGATLALGSGVYDNTGGVIESAGGQVRINNGARFSGGTISGADFAQTAGSTTSFTDITLNATIVVENNSDFDVLGTITNNGTITIASTGSATDVELQGATTFAGTGAIVLSGVNARINDFSGTQALTNGAGHTITGDGNIGLNSISIVNDGIIVGDGNASPLRIDPAGGATSSSFSGSGVIRAINGGSVFLESAGYDFADGTFEAIGAGSSIARSASTFNVFIGSVRAIDGGTVSVVDQSIADVDIIGNVDLIELRGPSNTDIFNNTAIIEIEPNGQTVGSPVSGDGFGFSRVFSGNSGTFIIGDGYDFRAGSFQNGEFTNSGTIVAEAGSTFSAAGYDILGLTAGSSTRFEATRSRAFVNTGTLAGSGTIANSNTLFGTAINPTTNGFFEGDFIESDGVIAPGDSATETGTMTLHARDIILGDSNDIQIDIGAGGFDAVDFITEPTTGLSGAPDTINTVELNGELSVNLLPGYTPAGGDTFVILTAVDGFVGTFDTETLPVLGGGVSFSLDYGPTAVTLLVEGVVGDYNGDGFVNAADYTVWRDSFGSTNDLAADGDQSGEIDQADFDAWAANYGRSAVVALTIPEPMSLTLLLLGLASPRRRR